MGESGEGGQCTIGKFYRMVETPINGGCFMLLMVVFFAHFMSVLGLGMS